MQKLFSRAAFSLVELSIVLVILGLLVGGVLSGQALIRAAELRAVSTEYQRYTAAAYSFRDKYFAIPGDMSNATSFWGKDATNCNGDSGNAGTPGTCNGNGDGLTTDAGAASTKGESFQFWKQLALAGLIEGTYSGISGTAAGRDATIGTNVPRSKMNNAGWSVSYLAPTYAGDGNAFAASISNYGGNHYRFGSKAANEYTQGPVLKPEEAWNIDTKMDDGNPVKGKIIAYNWATCTTAANNTDATAVYKLSDSSLDCALFTPLNM